MGICRRLQFSVNKSLPRQCGQGNMQRVGRRFSRHHMTCKNSIRKNQSFDIEMIGDRRQQPICHSLITVRGFSARVATAN